MAVAALPASAATIASCDYAAGVMVPAGAQGASGLCWLDWSGYSAATASSAAGQRFSLNLGNGYTATYTVTQRPVGATPGAGVTVKPVNSTTKSTACPYAPGYSYHRVPKGSRLYANWLNVCGASRAPADSVITLHNIAVTGPAGKPVTGYALVARDVAMTSAVGSVAGSAVTWSSDVPLTLFDAGVPQGAGTACPQNPTRRTTTVSCTSPATLVEDNPALQAVNPTTLSARVNTVARQAMAFAFEIVRANASGSSGTAIASPQGTAAGTASTGSGGSSSVGGVTGLPLIGASGTSSMAGTSSAGGLASYSTSWSCGSASTGSATALASVAGTSQAVAAADDIACTMTNTLLKHLSITKTASTRPYVPGQPFSYTVTVRNSGPAAAPGVTVSDPLPGNLAADGLTWTCKATAGSSCAASGIGNIIDTVNVAAGGILTYTVCGIVPATGSGALGNAATVTPPHAASAVTVPRGQARPALRITKFTGPSMVTGAGQTIGFTFVVANTGNVALRNVTLSRPQASPGGMLSSGRGCPSPTLAPGASETCAATYTVTKADAASKKVTVAAVASGTDPAGARVTSPTVRASIAVDATDPPSTVTVPSDPPATVVAGTPVPVTG